MEEFSNRLHSKRLHWITGGTILINNQEINSQQLQPYFRFGAPFCEGVT